jgi:hypothetical protein
VHGRDEVNGVFTPGAHVLEFVTAASVGAQRVERP